MRLSEEIQDKYFSISIGQNRLSELDGSVGGLFRIKTMFVTTN